MTTTKTKDAEPMEKEIEPKEQSSTAAFGFFRKHQKLIVYTAGIFTLLTFSITGAVMTVSEQWTTTIEMPTIQMPGSDKRVDVTEEDQNVGRAIARLKGQEARSHLALLAALPAIGGAEGESEDNSRFAALRRAAIESGLEGSAAVAEEAIQASIEAVQKIPAYATVQEAKDLASLYGIRDVVLFRRLVREAMRISLFLRLSSLAAGVSDQSLVDEIAKANEEIGFQVAVLDLKKIEEEKKKTKVSDEDLQKWLKEELEEDKQGKFRHPTNKAAFTLALLESKDFKADAYKEELKDYTPDEAEIQNYYDRYKDEYFKIPPKKKAGEDGQKPGEKTPGKNGDKTPGPDQKKKEQDKKKNEDKQKQGGEQNGGGQGEGQDPQSKASKPQGGGEKAQGEGTDTKKANEKKTNEQETDEQKADEKKADKPVPGEVPDPAVIDPNNQDAPTYRPLEEVKAEIVTKLMARRVLTEWRRQLDPLITEHLQEAVDAQIDANEKLAELQDKLKKAEEELEKDKDNKDNEKARDAAKKAVETQEKAVDVAKKAVDARLKAFDFRAAITRLAKGRPVKFVEVKKAEFAENLKELPEDLGTWQESYNAGSVTRSGEIHSSPQDIDKGEFLFQTTELVERPFKDFKDIKEDLTETYYIEQAAEVGKEKREKFEKALERLAKEKGKADIKKIEDKQAADLDKRFKAWRDKLNEEIEDLATKLNAASDGSFAAARLKDSLDQKRKILEGADDKKKEIEDELKAETEDEIKKVEKKNYKDVLAEAAKEGGFAIENVGPYTKALQTRPRYEYNYSKLEQFLYKDPAVLGMEEGEATDILDNSTDRQVCVAVCTKVQKATSKTITRRQWMLYANGLTLYSLKQQFMEDTNMQFRLWQQLQQNPSLRGLQQKLMDVIQKKEGAAQALADDPQFRPYLDQMLRSQSAPHTGIQRYRCVDQSFSMKAIRQALAFKEPQDPDKEGAKTGKPDGKGGKPDGKGGNDGKPESKRSGD